MESDAAWKQWGKADPYYGVLSDGRFRKESLQENREDFVRSGEDDWRTVMSTCTALYGNFKKGRAADFGCGVGRILAPMANDFSSTVGIDISPHMLAEAAKIVPQSELIISNDDLSNLTGELDFVLSFIVLQHIPTKRGLRLIRLLLDRLSPGGIAAIHVTLKRPTRFAKALVYFLKHRVPGARFVLNFLQGKHFNEPTMQMNQYSLENILQVFAACRMREVVLIPSYTGETLAVTVFARKIAV